MRRCTHCFRFHPGAPTFCSHCGRSFQYRICPRGHRSGRQVTFCAECGSAELSTAAPPATLLHRLSGIALYGFAMFIAMVLVLVVAFSALESVDWQSLAGPLVQLLIMLGFLYWTTTLIPGPIKKLTRSLGKSLVGSSRKEKRH